MTSDPKGRQVLITDGTSAVGMALARACVAAGAAKVWVGAQRCVLESYKRWRSWVVVVE
jgi:NAD(P)-dependent dehydrogenase (short-subunit alcohol dehydrogenase family)